MQILVLQHERSTPAGLFDDWARDRGHTLARLEVPELGAWPDPRGADAVLTLGSDCSVHASHEGWIAEEIAFLREAHDADVPILGICFGGQALSKALGGEVSRAPRVELGWQAMPTVDAALIPPGPWFRWHEDVFTVPPAARELVRVGDVPLAFAARRSVGLQFHPEVGAELVAEWIEGGRRQLAELAIDPDALGEQMARAARGARERAYDLFDRVAHHWSRATPDA